MQRDVLKQFLRAGPSRRFDVASFSRQLVKKGETRLLFERSFLNFAIFFKCVDMARVRLPDDVRTVSTLVYMPYDEARPEDGGESFIFCEENLILFCEYKQPGAHFDKTVLSGDLVRLSVLDSVPTFSPFIVELAVQRAGLDVPQAYLQLTPEDRDRLTAHLKGRLRPLIVAAYKRSSNVEKAVEELTTKLFSVRDVCDILPLVEALRLSPDTAPEVLTAWLGIAYFELEYAQLQPRLTEFAAWLNKYSQPIERLSRHDSEYLSSLVDAIRTRIRKDYNEIVSISSQYRTSYNGMVFKGELEPFVNFLGTARAFYWRMGHVLCPLEQTIHVWKHYTRNLPNRSLPYPILIDFVGMLRDVLLPENSSGQTQLQATRRWRPARSGITSRMVARGQ